MLLLDANRVVPADLIAEQLYRGEPPATAITQVQRQISELRKLLAGHATIETRSPGYTIMLEPGQLDLDRFERLLAEAEEAHASGSSAEAARQLDQALGLWRGPALADLSSEPFAQIPARRLEELRLLGLERRLEARLAAGQAASVVVEAQQLSAIHPTHERFTGYLMLALFRTGRQVDALAAYRELREALVDGYGVEPGPELRELEARILRHDPALAGQPIPRGSAGSVLMAVSQDSQSDAVLAVGKFLAQTLGYDALVATLAPEGAALPSPIRDVPPTLRTAAFTTANAALDVARLAQEQHTEVIVVPAGGLEGLADESTATVVSVGGSAFDPTAGSCMAVPFAGSNEDWAALEVAATLADASGASLRLVGPGGEEGQRDASRLLASASLAVQRMLGIRAECVISGPNTTALSEAVVGAAAVVVGAQRYKRWNPQVREPLIVVHRGVKPGLLAPPETRTRYTWSMREDQVQGGELNAS